MRIYDELEHEHEVVALGDMAAAQVVRRTCRGKLREGFLG